MQVFKDFPITSGEYEILSREFGELCEYAAWQLLKKNTRNNHTYEQADFAQELKAALVTSGSYYKRQTYIESCLKMCAEHVKDKFLKRLVEELQILWDNRTKHGANRQKFGPHQEDLLETLTAEIVPPKLRPNKNAPLIMDEKFVTYCKSTMWNKEKEMGRKITKDRSLRAGQVSLSDYDYLGAGL